MIRLFFYGIILLLISSYLYMFSSDIGNIEITISGYQITSSAGALLLITLFGFSLFFFVLWLIIWLKNLPSNLMNLKQKYSYRKTIDNIFSMICAYESKDYNKALHLSHSINLELIKHPIANFLDYKSSILSGNYREGEIEPKLFNLKNNDATKAIAIKELVNQKIKLGDFITAGEYLAEMDNLSFKPNWFFRTKITISIANKDWDGALTATNNKKFPESEAKHTRELIYYMQARELLNQNENDKAIHILKGNLNHIESLLLLVENCKETERLEYLAKAWKINPDYRILKAYVDHNQDSTAAKNFEMLELKLKPYDTLTNQYFCHLALALGLKMRARKYLEFAKDDSENYRKLLLLYHVQNNIEDHELFQQVEHELLK